MSSATSVDSVPLVTDDDCAMICRFAVLKMRQNIEQHQLNNCQEDLDNARIAHNELLLLQLDQDEQDCSNMLRLGPSTFVHMPAGQLAEHVERRVEQCQRSVDSVQSTIEDIDAQAGRLHVQLQRKFGDHIKLE